MQNEKAIPLVPLLIVINMRFCEIHSVLTESEGEFDTFRENAHKTTDKSKNTTTFALITFSGESS